MQLVKQPMPRTGPVSHRALTAAWRWPWGRPAIVVLVIIGLLFLLAPWPFGQKAHALLHGLCAQRFSHSFLLGGQALPFDARMTGIYGGFLTSFWYLAAVGRLRAWKSVSRSVIALLGTFVLLLAIDGSNSTLRDLGLWYLYEPDNRLRLATGLLTGIALATLLCYLLATTLWRRGNWTRATIRGIPEVGLLVLLQAPFAVTVLSGMGVLYTPVSVWLIGSAVVVFAAMALALLTILRKRDLSYRSLFDLQWPLAASLIVAVLAMGSLAGLRYLLEWWVGMPPLV